MAYGYGIGTSSPVRGSPVRQRPFAASPWSDQEESTLAGTGYWELSRGGGLLSPRKTYDAEVVHTRSVLDSMLDSEALHRPRAPPRQRPWRPGPAPARAGQEYSHQGVWVTPEMWRTVKRQLDTKLEDTHSVVHEHNKVVAELRLQLDAERRRNVDAEAQHERAERAVRQEAEEQRMRVLFLEKDLESAQDELSRTRSEAAAATRRLASALGSPLSPGGSRAEELTRTLDDASFRLRLEGRRNALHATRLDELQAEASHLRLQHASDLARCEAAEGAAAAARGDLSTLRLAHKQLRRELQEARGPEHEVQRLRADNGRLLALLEGTAEYRGLLADLSLGGRHYVGLSEVLKEQAVVTDAHCVPVRDRPLEAASEVASWVPRDAVALAHAFVARLQPRGLPAAPFMQLLLELNCVWQEHTRLRLQALRSRHATQISALRRQQRQAAPYRQVLAESELQHLRKLLKASSGGMGQGGGSPGRPLERMREAADAADSEESRLLLEWGMSTIESMSQQLNTMSEENLALRRRLMGDDEGGLAERSD